ncbi:hypothetical protein MMC30_005007 [Trapelia coarctata]|nr:hypothetical protein [Trapelia coarctata]
MSPTPTLHLLPATPADIPTFTSIYLSAFTDALALTAFPRSSPNIPAWWTATNLSDFHSQPSARYLKIVESDGGAEGDAVTNGMVNKEGAAREEVQGKEPVSGKIIAYAKWNVPTLVGSSVLNGGDAVDAMPEWPEDADVELCNDVFPAFARERERIMGGRLHYYLEIIATLPSHQGRGAASKLIRWGLQQADNEGLEAYLEASAAVVPIYERYGYRTVSTYSPKRIEYTESFMVRAPRGEGG